MGANISEGSKRATAFLKAAGAKPEWHDGASLANIISGYNPNRHFDRALTETRNYLKRAAIKISEEQTEQLVWEVHRGL